MYKQTRIYSKISHLVQKVHSFTLDRIFYELLKIQESQVEITYIEACHCAVRLHYTRRWYVNYNEGNGGKHNVLNKKCMITNIAGHIVEAKELEVKKIKVVEERVCENQRCLMKNKKLRKLTQSHS